MTDLAQPPAASKKPAVYGLAADPQLEEARQPVAALRVGGWLLFLAMVQLESFMPARMHRPA